MPVWWRRTTRVSPALENRVHVAPVARAMHEVVLASATRHLVLAAPAGIAACRAEQEVLLAPMREEALM